MEFLDSIIGLIWDVLNRTLGHDVHAFVLDDRRTRRTQHRVRNAPLSFERTQPRDFAFVALDEGQLGADQERGHIFTDRMLHARGREETMILGSASLTPMIRALLPKTEITSRPRFSTLSYAGPAKLSRLPPRSILPETHGDG